LIVSELPDGELHRLLGRSGLRLRLGPIVANIASPFETVEAALALHYASHEVLPDSEFADFHVAVDPVPGLRRWIRPQAYFRFDANPPFNPLAASQAFPLLEWGLNWCISAHCHQYLIIHGAVVERAGRALVMPAPPGSGKSTLCAALVARGWRLLSDELTLIDVETRRFVPLPRPVSLKNESIRVIAEFWPEARMSPVVHDTLKGSVAHVRPPSASVQLADQTAVPGWIVLPAFRAGEPMALTPLAKSTGFMRLVENAFNYSVLGRRGFDILADVVAASDCREFRYGGQLNDAIAVFDDLARVR
jgi:HprK-related kinase A